MLGTVTKRKKIPKDGPKLKVRLFDKVQTQETQKVPQEVPPVLHFYSDLHTVPDTFNSTMSSLLKGECIQAVSVTCEATI